MLIATGNVPYWHIRHPCGYDCPLRFIKVAAMQKVGKFAYLNFRGINRSPLSILPAFSLSVKN